MSSAEIIFSEIWYNNKENQTWKWAFTGQPHFIWSHDCWITTKFMYSQKLYKVTCIPCRRNCLGHKHKFHMHHLGLNPNFISTLPHHRWHPRWAAYGNIKGWCQPLIKRGISAILYTDTAIQGMSVYRWPLYCCCTICFTDILIVTRVRSKSSLLKSVNGIKE